MANPRGRQPIGVDQAPGGGTAYPFVQPSPDIQHLLGDLFVSFEDLNDAYEFPLKVAWLYGFGDDVVLAPPGYPTPTHAFDILIADANDLVVFDSTTAATFLDSVWDDRMLILEWKISGGYPEHHKHAVCRVVQHTEWTQQDIDDGIARSYDNYIVPTDGELQVDAWFKMPKRVTSLQVGLQTVVSNTVLNFSEGYNTALTPSKAVNTLATANAFSAVKTLQAGTRASTLLTVDVVPGAGLGVLPGCAEQELAVKTLNRVSGNKYQNFTYEAEGCIRSQRPVGLVSSDPREFDYASLVLPAGQARAAIESLNDCQNCCDCTYFAQTYQGIKRQWFLYKDVADAAELTRDLYQQNVNRWEAQKAIREVDTIRIRVAMNGNCKVNWGLAHCNASRCCIYNVVTDITFLYYLNGVLTTPATAGYSCDKAEIDGSAQCDGAEPIVLDIHPTGLHARAEWDYADPQTVTTLRERFCFPDCKDVDIDALKIQLHVVVSWETASSDPASGLDCTYPLLVEDDYPEDVLAVWSDLGVEVPAYGRSQKITPLTAISPENPYCLSCQCEPGGGV